MKTYRAAIIGIGGFGSVHVDMLSELAAEGLLEVVAFAELNVSASRASFDKLNALGAAHYTDYELMLKEHPDTDFVVIATPIAAHKPMCVRVMEMGFHVLVEKPPAVTIQDMDEMIAAQRTSGRLCQVNFQNTSGRAFRELLSRLEAGAVGKVERVTGVGMWMRTRAYYDRTRWAGKLAYNGQYVLDGTFNNPFAHLLQNCLLAAGAGNPSTGMPETVQAELYHVNDIEGDDVSCIRVGMPGGMTVGFYAMLCHSVNAVPYIEIRGTDGEIRWDYDNRLTIRVGGAEDVVDYGSEKMVRNMYLNLMGAIDDPAAPLYSPIDACRGFVLVSNGAYESAKSVRAIPQPYATEQEQGDSTLRLLPGLSERIAEVAAEGKLYAEVPFPWAAATEPASMKDYRHFGLFADMK